MKEFFRRLRKPPVRNYSLAEITTVMSISLGFVAMLLIAIAPFIIPFPVFWIVIWEALLCLLLSILSYVFARTHPDIESEVQPIIQV